jgi:Ca2+-binding RTX toxin-like protein
MPGLLEFMADMRFRESSDNYQETDNPQHYGAYQFGRAAFRATGYIAVDSNGNEYWTGKDGIGSFEDWTASSQENPEIERIQDKAFLEWVKYLWVEEIRRNNFEPLDGQTLNGVYLTISGIVAGAHLVGGPDFRNRYLDSGGVDIVTDGDGISGTPVTSYITFFEGYDLTDISGVAANIIPFGFVSVLINHHEWDNTFNRRSDSEIDFVQDNPGLNDYPMHLGTGDDSINGFGGNDTVFGASGGNDTMDGGTHTEGIGDTFSYDEATGPISISLIVDQSGIPQASPHFLAQGWGDGTDEFFNFERIVISDFNDLFVADTAIDSIQLQGIKIEAGLGDDTIRSGNGDDVIFGGAGADELFGGGGDDVIIFDFDDTEIVGGEGRDIAVFQGDDGAIDLDATASELEVVIAGNAGDTLHADGSAVVALAGGGGNDAFNLQMTGSSPTIVWGGAGADTLNLNVGPVPSNAEAAGILVVNVAGLTLENFHLFDYLDLGLGPDFDWGQIDVVLLNPDSSDRVLLSSDDMSAQINVNNFGPIVERGIFLEDGGLSYETYGQHQEDSVLMEVAQDFFIEGQVGHYEQDFLAGYNGTVFAPADRIISLRITEYRDSEGETFVQLLGDPETGEHEFQNDPLAQGLGLGGDGWDYEVDRDYDLSSAAFVSDWTTADGSYGSREHYFYMLDTGPISNPSGWFVVGGAFDGNAISGNGAISYTMPGPGPGDALFV